MRQKKKTKEKSKQRLNIAMKRMKKKELQLTLMIYCKSMIILWQKAALSKKLGALKLWKNFRHFLTYMRHKNLSSDQIIICHHHLIQLVSFTLESSYLYNSMKQTSYSYLNASAQQLPAMVYFWVLYCRIQSYPAKCTVVGKHRLPCTEPNVHLDGLPITDDL